MNRTEYLNQLQKYLRKLPKTDYENAIDYFTEYFDEAGEENEEQAIKELGSPKEAASELLQNLLEQDVKIGKGKEETEETKKPSVKRTFLIMFLALLTTPLGVPAICGVMVIMLAVVFALLVIMAVVLLISVALIYMGGKYFVYGIMAIPKSLSGACMLTGAGMVGVGSGVLLSLLVGCLCRGILWGMVRLVNRF